MFTRTGSCAGWRAARLPLADIAVAVALGAFGLGFCCPQAIARAGGEVDSSAAAAPREPSAGWSSAALVVGNAELKARLDVPGKLTIAGERMHDDLLRRFYTVHGYNTLWDSRPAQATALWNAVSRAGDHGLDPSRFHGAVLAEQAVTLSPVERDLLLSDTFLSYAEALARGAVPIAERTDDEDLTPEPVDVVAVLDAAMENPDPAKEIEALAPSSAEYQAMRRAYASYRALALGDDPTANSGAQARLNRDSRATAERQARQLAVNLERLRWLPRVMPADRVVVNAAIARLQFFRGDRPLFSTRVVVGKIGNQTPEFRAAITGLLYNPPWNIPRSIVQKEILPRLAADPDYLSRHRMRFRGGASIQQEPGPGNALGQLKFEMPNRHDVYLHDTPTKSLFQSAERTMSHGCVRVENPRALGALLLQENPEAIDFGIARGYTNRHELPMPLPVLVVYQTASVEADGSIQFRADPYRRDEGVWQRLDRWRHPPIAQRAAITPRKG